VNALEARHDALAKVFKALCDPNRLLIIDKLQSGELCACQILDDLNISQSTLSHHMKNLCESGVVNCRREGKWMFYSLNKKGCEAAYSLLTGIMEAPAQSKVDEKCTCE
jgi:ArsR family transcriptional regulator